MIKKNNLLFFSMLLIVLSSNVLLSQGESITGRAQNSTIDEGFYWDNGFKGRWNPFGGYYLTRLYYRKALSRENNNFWHAGSAIEVGVEQSLSSLSKTSAFIFWQPIIAFNVTAKVGYAHDFIRTTLLNGPNDDYTHTLPPFTGQNPMNREPKRTDVNTLEVELIPSVTFGGGVGSGMLALIYTPHMIYFNNFGIDKDQYIYNNREAIVIKGEDIFIRHDIKLGYIFSGKGMSVALVTLVEQVVSLKDVFRVGVFGAFSYEKSLKKKPNIIPYFRGQVGAWVEDRYMEQYFAIQIDTGIKWKFK